MNRNERITDNNSVYVPTLVISDHLASINDMAKDVKYREDVVKSVTASASDLTIDMTDTDRYEVNSGTLNVALTINGTDDGDVKYLIITKQTGKTFTFVGATSQAINIDFVNSATSLLFRIVNKKSVIYAELLNKSFDKATDAEALAGTDTNKYVTPAQLAGNAWIDITTYGTNWSGDVRVRMLDPYTLAVTGVASNNGAGGEYVFQLPGALFLPRTDFEMVLKEYGSSLNLNYRMAFLDSSTGSNEGWLFQGNSVSGNDPETIPFYHVFKFK